MLHVTTKESSLLQMTKAISKWRTVLVRASAFWSAVILIDVVLVYFFGPQLWSYGGWFGNDSKTTLVVLLFIEGGVLFAFGAMWASGAMETTFGSSNIRVDPYHQREPWKQRREQTEEQNVIGKILMLAGGPLLIASSVLLFA